MTQLGLLTDVERVEKPRKRQRSTARAIYKALRVQGEARRHAGKETREDQVLRCLAAYWNRHQESPTARELFAWMQMTGERVDDVNSCRPRLTYLCEVGLIEASEKRTCSVSGKTVHTWRVREIGA